MWPCQMRHSCHESVHQAHAKIMFPVPTNPIQNPSYFGKLLCSSSSNQASSQSASCFPPLIEMFQWAVEWWDCYFLQLGFQQQLCKCHLTKQRISKPHTAKVIRFGQHLPSNTSSTWRWDCSKRQNKFQSLGKEKSFLWETISLFAHQLMIFWHSL